MKKTKGEECTHKKAKPSRCPENHPYLCSGWERPQASRHKGEIREFWGWIITSGQNIMSKGCPKQVATMNSLAVMNASGADRSSQRAHCDPQLFQPIPSADQWILVVQVPNLSTLWESCWPQHLRQATRLMLLTMADTLHF